MLEFEELNFSDEVRYSKEHTWSKIAGGIATVGISDYAQNQLREIIFIELPAVADSFCFDQCFGCVESVKTSSELYMPIGREVLAINQELEDNPELVNEDPFGKGWMLKIKIDDMSQFESLLDSKSYISSFLEP